ncbi:glycosyltransferase [Pseudodesulfovibrio tunisiensis]|uniref:glycosyltransferase n=1 Tax=Pseudodesulfovibrio tunisiensis TaxID=463192 RepID=UPI001FB56DBD|nr:glycosyltransferase [Pseudodesulfovibrio tunisiensis]
MNIAMITPWPGDKSGIADCAYATADALIRNTPCRIAVYTANETPKSLPGVVIKPIDLIRDEHQTYDLVLMHLGNNPYHDGYIDILKEIDCVVHIHDMVLHHLYAGETHGSGQINRYIDEFSKWYGDEPGQMVRALLTKGIGVWDTDIVIDCPMFEPYLQHSLGCLITSSFVERRISRTFPDIPIKKVSLINQTEKSVSACTENASSTHPTQDINVGVFGFITRNKLVDVVLQAVKGLAPQFDNFKLHIVGGVEIDCVHLMKWVEKNDLVDVVQFYGRVDNNRWMELLGSMDLIISLRHPTMGETSGVVTDALSLNIPVVVNDTGSYRELPFVKRLPIENIHTTLSDYLETVFRVPEELATIKANLCKMNSLCDTAFKAKTYFKALLELADHMAQDSGRKERCKTATTSIKAER